MSKTEQSLIPACKAAGRPKASDAEARMHDLLNTAGMMFLQCGYTKVSLEAIARKAHVAVRTIYVKFGGKAGLLKATLESRRESFFASSDMLTDPRPMRAILDEFAVRFLDLMASDDVLAMQRVVIAEARDNPELAETFFEHGPRITRDMLAGFFGRPDIRAQLRDGLAPDMLTTHLINCISGDQLVRFLFAPPLLTREETLARLAQRLDLFYRAVLRDPLAG